jgi:AI-2 transport protein TqsA
MEIKLNSVMKPLGIMAAIAIVIGSIKAIGFIVGPLVLAFLFVAVLRPMYSAMIRRRFPRGIAVLLTVIVFILIVAFVGWVFALAISQTIAIAQQYSGDITARLTTLDATLSTLPSYASGLSGLLNSSLNPSVISGFLTAFISALTSFISSFVVLFFLFLFTLTNGPVVMKKMREKFGDSHQLTRKTVSFLDNLARYFILRTLVNAITGVGIALTCLLMGIPNAFVWGLLTFVLSYIPYIGMFIACVPPGLIAFANGGVTELSIFVVACVVINGIAEQVVSPIVTGRGLSVSPMLIFVSFIFWGWCLGPIGYVVAVPMTVMVLLFMNSFEETAGYAGLFSDIPEPEA